MESGVEEHLATKIVKRYNIRGPVNPIATPIINSSTYILANAEHGALLSDLKPPKDGQSPWLYSRWGNPTNDVAAQAITAIEHGETSYVLSSGMAAISTVFFGFLKAGDHAIVAAGTYGGTNEFLGEILPKYGIEVTLVNMADVQSYEKKY